MSQRKNYRGKKGASGSAANPANAATSSQLQTLTEMFPDWDSEELASLLSEHLNDVETVIDLIVNNKVSKWEPIKREPKQRKRDDVQAAAEISHPPASATSVAHAASATEQKGKSLRDRHSKPEKRRERRAPASKKDSVPAAALAAATAATGNSTAAVSAPTPGVSTTTASAPLNSWAAALAKDNKPKPKPASKAQTKETPAAVDAPVQEVESVPAPQIESQQTTDPEVAAKKSLNVQAGTSWASAIKPKTPVKASTKKFLVKTPLPTSTDEVVAAPSIVAQANVEPEPVSEQEENPASEVAEVQSAPEPTAAEIPQEMTLPLPVREAAVVLPQQVNNVGVSFGSLSLHDGQKDASASLPQDQSQDQIATPEAFKQESIETQNAQSQQAAQQAYQQQYEQQQRKTGSSQGYDYYNQFQQSQQQFPQQGAAANMPAQFGYPSFDYAGAYGQQTGAGTMSSPGYYHVGGNNAGAKTGGNNSAASANGNEVTQSPLVSNALNQQGIQAPQQSQIPGAAPFAYPNYYSYFYNTPFYGNGANMGANNNVYGMQPQQQPQQQQGQQQQLPQQPQLQQLQQLQQASQQLQQGSEAGAIDNDSGNGQGSGHFAQGANQYYAAQYYGNPSQFGNRAGYPYSTYPSSQSYPQGNQSGQATEQTEQQTGQQSTLQNAPNGVPQYPQQMPQYAGYQQYPQYGTYQDNSQYRGWY